jgi:hypothetical protein
MPGNDDSNEYWTDEEEMTEEQRLRSEFPAAQDAWEQYQTVLKLCRESKPKPEINQNAAEILTQIRARQAQKINKEKRKKLKKTLDGTKNG